MLGRAIFVDGAKPLNDLPSICDYATTIKTFIGAVRFFVYYWKNGYWKLGKLLYKESNQYGKYLRSSYLSII